MGQAGVEGSCQGNHHETQPHVTGLRNLDCKLKSDDLFMGLMKDGWWQGVGMQGHWVDSGESSHVSAQLSRACRSMVVAGKEKMVGW